MSKDIEDVLMIGGSWDMCIYGYRKEYGYIVVEMPKIDDMRAALPLSSDIRYREFDVEHYIVRKLIFNGVPIIILVYEKENPPLSEIWERIIKHMKGE